MSTRPKQTTVNERKQQILQEAIEIIAENGYGKLTMRALARASGMKLGALQYHFPRWEDLLVALASYVSDAYLKSFNGLIHGNKPPPLRDVVSFIIDDAPGSSLSADRLFPQLWAMAQVEPVMSEALDEIYVFYLSILENGLVSQGSQEPRAQALALMSLVEGSTHFVGHGRSWENDASSVRDVILELIDTWSSTGPRAGPATVLERQRERQT